MTTIKSGEKFTPLISVIIANYNGSKFLEICLPSLERQSFKNFEVIIVDNGSTDASKDYVRTYHPAFLFISNTVNTFASANNVGMRRARGSLFFILNNDVEIDPFCLQKLAETAQEDVDEVGMWAPKILNFYRREEIDSVGLAFYPDGLSRGRGRLEIDNHQFDCKEEVFFPSGCASLFRRELIEQVGGYDEDFEFYVEDSDLGYRARLAGWKCMYVPDAHVYHMYSVSLGKYSPKKVYLVERNRVWFVVKLLPLPYLFLNPWFSVKRYVFQIYGLLTQKGAASNFTKKYSFFRLGLIFIHAMFSAALKLPRMIQKRKRIMENCKVSRKEQYSWFHRFVMSVREIALKE